MRRNWGTQKSLVCRTLFAVAPSFAAALLFSAARVEAQSVASSTSEPQVPHLVAVRATGSCPSASDVERELKPLLSKWGVARESEEVLAAAQIEDRGDAFLISIQGESREVDSSASDCGERARIAAVVIAMQLETPMGWVEPPVAKTQSHTAEEKRQAAHAFSPLDSEFEARELFVWEIQGALLVAGGFDEITPIGAGPRVAVQVTMNNWLLRLSAGVLFFSPTDVQQLSLSYLRVPTELGFGRELSAGDWMFAPSLALALDPFRIDTSNFEEAQGATRLDVGTRVMLQVSHAFLPLRPVLELQAAWFPRDFEIYVSPQGEIARTPNFWWGVSLGGNFSFRER